MLLRDQLPAPCLLHNGLEEVPRDLVLQEPPSVLAEGGGVEGRIPQVEIQEPLEQEVVLQPLAELTFASNRVQRDQQAALEQPLRRNRGSTSVGIHAIERR